MKTTRFSPLTVVEYRWGVNALKNDMEEPGARNDSLLEYLSEVVAATPAGAGGVLFTPWLHGNRSPFEDPRARMGVSRIRKENLDVPTHIREVRRNDSEAAYNPAAFQNPKAKLSPFGEEEDYELNIPAFIRKRMAQ